MLAKAGRCLQNLLALRSFEPSEAWEHGLETAKLMQLRRDAKCSFRENLIWLEEMSQFSRDFARLRFVKGLHPPLKQIAAESKHGSTQRE